MRGNISNKISDSSRPNSGDDMRKNQLEMSQLSYP